MLLLLIFNPLITIRVAGEYGSSPPLLILVNPKRKQVCAKGCATEKLLAGIAAVK
jgi:hypothetical protein